MIGAAIGIALIVGGIIAMVRGFFLAYRDAVELNNNLDEKLRNMKSNRLENYLKNEE